MPFSTAISEEPTSGCYAGLRLHSHVDVWKIDELTACRKRCEQSALCNAITFVPEWRATGSCIAFDTQAQPVVRTRDTDFNVTSCFGL